MDSENRSSETELELSDHACECPEPCNCVHDNE